MSKRPPSDGEGTSLRRRAEQTLLARETRGTRPDDAYAAALLHELQVHEIELEMQNDELRRAHAELQATRDRYADLYDFAPVGYFTIGTRSEILEANLTGARTLGIERAKLVGRRLLELVGAADRSRFERTIDEVRRRGEQESLEVVLDHGPDAPHRSPRYLQLTFSRPPPPPSLEGEVLRVAAVDTTERHHAEERVRTAQKLEAIGQLAGGIAHDFNNVLTVILFHADQALEVVPHDAPVHENVTELKAAAERAAALTRQLLAFSRKQVVRPDVVDVNERLRKIAAMLQRLLGEDIALVLQLAPDLGRVEIDPVQLDQVIMNLAVNARDAMPLGGTLTLMTENADGSGEWVSSGEASPPARKAVRLTVADAGVGIDPQAIPHIFEPFFTTKDVGQGTGLGLSTVFGIVESCGGRISVRSEPGKGAAFELDFPRRDAVSDVRPPAKAAGAEAPKGGTETILVVEDEPAVLRATSRVLRTAGYQVLIAASGAEGLLRCEEHEGPIHLVVCDVMMPAMTGVEFVERMKRLRPGSRVLLVSGYTGDALARRGLDEPKLPLLSKPFTSHELLREVRGTLDAPS